MRSARRLARIACTAKRLASTALAHDTSANSPGAAAGLFELVMLPDGTDEHTLVSNAAARGVGVEGLALHRFLPGGPPGLVLGYGNLSEPAIEQGMRLLGEAFKARH